MLNYLPQEDITLIVAQKPAQLAQCIDVQTGKHDKVVNLPFGIFTDSKSSTERKYRKGDYDLYTLDPVGKFALLPLKVYRGYSGRPAFYCQVEYHDPKKTLQIPKFYSTIDPDTFFDLVTFNGLDFLVKLAKINSKFCFIAADNPLVLTLTKNLQIKNLQPIRPMIGESYSSKKYPEIKYIFLGDVWAIKSNTTQESIIKNKKVSFNKKQLWLEPQNEGYFQLISYREVHIHNGTSNINVVDCIKDRITKLNNDWNFTDIKGFLNNNSRWNYNHREFSYYELTSMRDRLIILDPATATKDYSILDVFEKAGVSLDFKG